MKNRFKWVTHELDDCGSNWLLVLDRATGIVYAGFPLWTRSGYRLETLVWDVEEFTNEEE